MENNFIKEFWDKQGEKFGKSHEASWADLYCVYLEIENISKYIKENDKVLDVGCSNGFSAMKQLKKNKIVLEGIDFSEKMITQARKNLIDFTNNENFNESEANFGIGDIKHINFPDETFDVTYTTRVLINLQNWEDQIQGINECLRVTKKGGFVLLSEAFYEPLQKLNALRILASLDALVEHDFNRYIKKQKIEKFLSSNNINFECIDFSSIYYLGSRFLREVCQYNESNEVMSIYQPDYVKNSINRWFYELEEKYNGKKLGVGIQQLYVIKK